MIFENKIFTVLEHTFHWNKAYNKYKESVLKRLIWGYDLCCEQNKRYRCGGTWLCAMDVWISKVTLRRLVVTWGKSILGREFRSVFLSGTGISVVVLWVKLLPLMPPLCIRVLVQVPATQILSQLPANVPSFFPPSLPPQIIDDLRCARCTTCTMGTRVSFFIALTELIPKQFLLCIVS